MSDYDANRRQLLQFLLYAPLGLALSCRQAEYSATELGPQESLKKLILVLGPWPAAELGEAEEFAARFLASKVASGPYLQDSGQLLQSLARRFPDESISVDEIDLARLPEEERDLLLSLASQIYSLTEIRFMVSGQPLAGECQGEATLHTLRPS